jgi:translocation and assembly module TamA
VASLQKADAKSGQEVTQNVADETQFAGTQPTDQQSEKSQVEQQKMQQRASENDQLQAQAREEKKVPVIVTLNADRLNSVETGIGYGTDTEFRIRTQYRRAIVNSLGHSFDANLELSKIRQAIDGRYSIPYKDPINDYINLVGGYERRS